MTFKVIYENNQTMGLILGVMKLNEVTAFKVFKMPSTLTYDQMVIAQLRML